MIFRPDFWCPFNYPQRNFWSKTYFSDKPSSNLTRISCRYQWGDFFFTDLLFFLFLVSRLCCLPFERCFRFRASCVGIIFLWFCFWFGSGIGCRYVGLFHAIFDRILCTTTLVVCLPTRSRARCWCRGRDVCSTFLLIFCRFGLGKQRTVGSSSASGRRTILSI